MKKVMFFAYIVLAGMSFDGCRFTDGKNTDGGGIQELLLLDMKSWTSGETAPLEGIWQNTCGDISGMPAAYRLFGAGSSRSLANYLGDRRYLITYYYSDTACSGNLLASVEKNDDFLLEGPVMVSSREVERIRTYAAIPGTMLVTASHPDAVTQANAAGGFGLTEWTLNRGRNVPATLLYDGSDMTAIFQGMMDAGWDTWYRSYFTISVDTMTMYIPMHDFEKNAYPDNLDFSIVYTR